MYMANVQQALFKLSQPHKSCNVHGFCTNRGSGGFAGMYYVTAPKIGSMLTYSSLKPFREYPVSAEWIFNMIQQDKFEYKSAKTEVIRCGKGLTRRLQDLERWRQPRQQ